MIECNKFMDRKSNSKHELEDRVAYGPAGLKQKFTQNNFDHCQAF